ncbi:hypothetical protein GGX14DRAFT_405507 [Mycena pura]|uniref:Uncharacterized protein n=1 Tax=Mycena pura TaxID=153505 RepID=A0AAD6Y2F6_9AGAR|nr:hypothetical protein GGX14DRAFT_405507 [Mycena pura]
MDTYQCFTGVVIIWVAVVLMLDVIRDSRGFDSPLGLHAGLQVLTFLSDALGCFLEIESRCGDFSLLWVVAFNAGLLGSQADGSWACRHKLMHLHTGRPGGGQTTPAILVPVSRSAEDPRSIRAQVTNWRLCDFSLLWVVAFNAGLLGSHADGSGACRHKLMHLHGPETASEKFPAFDPENFEERFQELMLLPKTSINYPTITGSARHGTAFVTPMITGGGRRGTGRRRPEVVAVGGGRQAAGGISRQETHGGKAVDGRWRDACGKGGGRRALRRAGDGRWRAAGSGTGGGRRATRWATGGRRRATGGSAPSRHRHTGTAEAGDGTGSDG